MDRPTAYTDTELQEIGEGRPVGLQNRRTCSALRRPGAQRHHRHVHRTGAKDNGFANQARPAPPRKNAAKPVRRARRQSAADRPNAGEPIRPWPKQANVARLAAAARSCARPVGAGRRGLSLRCRRAPLPSGASRRSPPCASSTACSPRARRLDLTLEEDRDDAPGSRPGQDMLCCGLRTRAETTGHHQARSAAHACRGSSMMGCRCILRPPLEIPGPPAATFTPPADNRLGCSATGG
jgi:GcrA cell cycle regulator